MKKRLVDVEALCKDEILIASLKERGLLLYQTLWCISDDWGGYDPDYSAIALTMGYLRYDSGEVAALIAKLIKLGKIIPYLINAKEYHWLKNLTKHQNLHCASGPTIPTPPWIVVTQKRFPSNKISWLYSINDTLLPADVKVVQQQKKPVRKYGLDPVEAEKRRGYFEQFYEAYPNTRRIGREVAWKAFCKIVPIVNDKNFKDLMHALNLYKMSPDWRKNDGQYIPKITKFINERWWENMIAAVPTNKKDDRYEQIIKP